MSLPVRYCLDAAELRLAGSTMSAIPQHLMSYGQSDIIYSILRDCGATRLVEHEKQVMAEETGPESRTGMVVHLLGPAPISCG